MKLTSYFICKNDFDRLIILAIHLDNRFLKEILSVVIRDNLTCKSTLSMKDMSSEMIINYYLNVLSEEDMNKERFDYIYNIIKEGS